MNAVNVDPGIESHFGEVLAAYLEAVDAGWAPDRRAFLARYPQWQHELEAFFAAQDEVHHLAEPFRPFTPSPKGETPTGDWVAVRDANITVSEPTTATTDDPYPSFGDFEMLQEIARGGMGVVYRARQISLNRVVALKMILAGRFASAAELQRFRNEAEAAALMDHSGIVPIYQVGEYKGQPWFIMKLIEGGSLAEHMPRFERGSRAAVSLLVEVARAVHYAHQRGILHRDLKPANILLDEHGHPLVTDFGLAKRVEADAALTDSNAIVGTPSYMAPEQAMGKRGGLTTATDTYSLGAILFEMLTGRPPFKADNPLETLLLLREQPPAPPRSLNPKIDRDLELICLKCLEKEHARRYSTAADLADDLERWLCGEPIVCRPVGTAERLLKWTRHHPSLAALSGLAALVLVLVCVSMGVLWQLGETKRAWQEEARRAQEAETASDKAEMERHRAEEQTLLAESALYINRVWLAHSELLNNEVARADQILDECPDFLRNWEWHYVKHLCHSEERSLKGHTGSVLSVAFSFNGQRLASASEDQMVKIWDMRTGQEILTLKGHSGRVYSVAFSPSGNRLASASEDHTVKIWDAQTGQEVHTLKGHTSDVNSVTFSPDGQRLVSASGDHTVKVWDARTGQESFTLNGHVHEVNSVAFSPDGQRLASASWDRMVKVWDAHTGQEALTLKGHTSSVYSIAFSLDSKRLASASQDRTVKLWDAHTGQEALTLNGHANAIHSVCFSPDGQRLATASEDHTVKLWDTRTGQQTLTLKGKTERTECVAFSPNGTRLAGGSSDGSVKVWDATPLTKLHKREN